MFRVRQPVSRRDRDPSALIILRERHSSSDETAVECISKPKLAVEPFNEADRQKPYTLSSDRHRLIWMAFCMLGLRDEELAYTFWSNIDWRIVTGSSVLGEQAAFLSFDFSTYVVISP